MRTKNLDKSTKYLNITSPWT